MTDNIAAVGIIMGSTSDMPIVRKACDFLESMRIPFELHALSAHRTPAAVERYATGAAARGLKVIIAAAGMSAALPGVIAALTPLPVIGLPVASSLSGIDALLSMAQMPPAIPVATVGVNAGLNAGVLAARIIALTDTDVASHLADYMLTLSAKVEKADAELATIEDYKYKI